MEQSTSAFAPSVLERWRRRENLLPALALLALAAAGWVYVAYQAAAMGAMRSPMSGMTMSAIGEIVLFLCLWTVMMVAMMVPATLPLMLLYRTIARNRLSQVRAHVGMVTLLVGYVAVWAVAGLPVYAYNTSAGAAAGSLAGVLPALLLIFGGAYQFTPLKRICHVRCSSPLFFLIQNWRSGAAGALRMGMLHGVDCLGNGVQKLRRCCPTPSPTSGRETVATSGSEPVPWPATSSAVRWLQVRVPACGTRGA